MSYRKEITILQHETDQGLSLVHVAGSLDY